MFAIQVLQQLRRQLTQIFENRSNTKFNNTSKNKRFNVRFQVQICFLPKLKKIPPKINILMTLATTVCDVLILVAMEFIETVCKKMKNHLKCTFTGSVQHKV